MPGRRIRFASHVAVIVCCMSQSIAGGCISIGAVSRAQTVGKGKYEVSVEPGFWPLQIEDRSINLPSLNGALRYGISDRVDIGARIGTGLLEFQSKFLLTRPEHKWLAISLAPSFGGVFGGAFGIKSGYLNVPVPLLIGLKLGKHELTLGPRVQNLLGSGGSSENKGALFVLLGGGSIGFGAQVTPKFRILPELAVVTPLMAAAINNGSGVADRPTDTGTFAYMFNLGFQFGSSQDQNQ